MIRKAVIPAAGLGTRMLPITKAVPKEMLPVVDRPVIQYVVEEAVASGIEDIIIVLSRGKEAIQGHFAKTAKVRDAGDAEASLERILDRARFRFVWQKEPNGLGDAVACARDEVAGEPFAVLLGDALFDADVPVTRQLIGQYERAHASVIALEEVALDKVNRYGIAGGALIGERLMRIERFQEKPAAQESISRWAIAARYLLEPDIFDYLAGLGRGKNNEIQLTDAIARMAAERPVHGYRIEGVRYDTGDLAGYQRANEILAKSRGSTRSAGRPPD
jgi:UTP--glucose-1-phosphate uridylyltransferase